MRRILIIDDDDDVREVAALALEAVGGVDVVSASSGAEGIELAEAERPDAILLDVMMPGMDGPATFRVLRGRDETRMLPVVLLTAKAQRDDRRRFEALGVDAVLTKPFDPMRLADDVSAALGWTS